MIAIPVDLREKLIAYARSEAPKEACGVILREGARLRLRKAENVSESPHDSFAIAPREQLKILTGNGEPVALFHSHPVGPPTPSQTDAKLARNWPGLAWVIAGQVRCECVLPLMGGVEDNDLIPDEDCPDCQGTGSTFGLWVGSPAA